MNSFHRRDFLRGAATLAGTSLLPSLTRLAQAQAPVDPNQTVTPPVTPAAPKAQIARGRVVLDRTGTGKPDAKAPGVPNVRVSNGRDIVSTDAQGRYQLPIIGDAIIFIQKPAGFKVPLNEFNQPQSYYIHKPLGSPTDYRFQGVAPTGELPASIDFVLAKQAEPDAFRAVLWGDPQPRNLQEIDYVARDIASDLVGVDAAFGLSLGDNSFNNLSLFRPLKDVTASLGIPWHTIIGNHDQNYDAPDDTLAAETFKAAYGPTYFSFDYGQAHFVALDNVVWLGAHSELKNGNYTGGFGEQQLTWLKNDLAGVPPEKLVVVFMHIPIVAPPAEVSADVPGKPPRFIESDRRAFLALLENHPRTLSISGHTHVHNHSFLETRDGWNGRTPHHHFNCGTTSGSWWSGPPDEEGIPNTTMRDGTPNGYAFLNINKGEYTLDWRAARSRPEYQMAITAPAQIEAAKVADAVLKVNVFNGSAKTRVESRIGNGAWTKMERVSAMDPGYVALKNLEDAVPAFADDASKALKAKAPWIALPKLEESPHLWQMALPSLPVGAHWIQIRATDQWNRTFEEKRLVRVV